MGSLTTGLDHTKRCLRCRGEKPLTEFYACKGMIDGRDSTCRACKIAANRQRREQTKLGTGSLLRLSPTCSRGELGEETFESRRDEYLLNLAAAANRWTQAEDQEDRAGARAAVLFRCRQLLEAEGLVGT